MDRHDRAASRRSALNGRAAGITAFVSAMLAIAAGSPYAPAATPPPAGARPLYADSSRAGVLEFLTVAIDGRRGRIVMDRYVQDFQYCSGVVHRIDAHGGDAETDVITTRGGGTVRVHGPLATVDEPGARGVHHFRALSDPRERTRLVRAFFDREARLRRSIHYPGQLAAASGHCKK